MNSDEIFLTEHFKQRGKQRVSKSLVKIEKLANEAYHSDCDLEDVNDEDIRRSIEAGVAFGRVGKVYRGYVYWFCGKTAITVYPISKKKAMSGV